MSEIMCFSLSQIYILKVKVNTNIHSNILSEMMRLLQNGAVVEIWLKSPIDTF